MIKCDEFPPNLYFDVTLKTVLTFAIVGMDQNQSTQLVARLVYFETYLVFSPGNEFDHLPSGNNDKTVK